MKAIKKVLLLIWGETFKFPRIRLVNRYYRHMKEDKYPQALKRQYKKKTGKSLNLDNPRTFNEKIQWSKLYDRNPIKTKLADKYSVREWVAGTIGEGYLIPLLGVWDSADDIDFDALPERYVLKVNNASKRNIVVTDKSEININRIRRQLRRWLKVNIAFTGGLELHYAGIEPRIIAEAYMEDTVLGELMDYKFFCYGGRPVYCEVDVDRYIGHKRNIYDLEWNLLPVRYNYPNADRALDKPKTFEEMVDVAKKLSKGFPFVRVDLYSIEGKVYFGEMTFTPLCGTGEFDPPEYDAVFGEPWELQTG